MLTCPSFSGCVCAEEEWHFCEIIAQTFYIRRDGFPNGGLNYLEPEEEISVAGLLEILHAEWCIFLSNSVLH